MFLLKIADIIYVFVIGMVIGIGNVIPGVSGGTMAVVFNIYDRFVNAITLNVKKLIKNWRFVVPVFLGMATGIYAFSSIIEKIYNAFPVQTNYFFTGLIIGSIPMLIKYMNGKNKDSSEKLPENQEQSEDKKKSKGYIALLTICILAGIAMILAFDYLNTIYGDGGKDMNFVMPELSIKLALRLFIAGVLGAVAMVIPGISGSLLMLILGVWPIVIGAIKCILHPSMFVHATLLLLPNGIGVVLGIVLGAKLISYLLKKAPGLTYAVIVGLLIGSVYTLFPGFSDIHSFGRGAGSFISLAAGIFVSYFTSTYSKKDNKIKNEKEIETDGNNLKV